MFHQMFVQKRFGGITIVANLAHEGLWVAVLEQMRLVPRRYLERLAASLARVGRRVSDLDVLVQHSQTRVQVVAESATKVPLALLMHTRHVAQQSCPKREYLAAKLACQILRWQMRLDVHLQRDLVIIALSALVALVRLDSRVNIVVLRQVEFRSEPLWALGALYRPWIRVRAPDVLDNVRLANEFRRFAQRTGVLPNAQVRFHVNGALVPTLVALLAQLANVTHLAVNGDLFDVVVHSYLLPIHLVELLWVLSNVLLFGLQQLLELLVVVLVRAAAHQFIDDIVDLRALVILH